MCGVLVNVNSTLYEGNRISLVINFQNFAGLWVLKYAEYEFFENHREKSQGKQGGRLNKKDGLTRYGDSHVKDKTS